MKKIISLCLIFVILMFGLIFKSCGGGDTIVIYTSTEDYNMELLQKRLDEAFPNYNIVVEYVSTSNITTKVIEEGSNCECDIIYHQEYTQLDMMIKADVLANIEGQFDFSVFDDSTILERNKNYLIPTIRSGGAVIINKKVLADNNLPKPTSYEDLLSPKYKGLLSMPSPKSSSTGYMFYLALVNAWGESKALEYFDKYAENIIQFTSSGSGPVNALTNREAAVGFGMIAQAADKITAGNNELEILFFDEGAPYALYGTSIVKGKETKKGVLEVMDYIHKNYINEACQKFYPELILKDKQYEVKNFPKNILYANMDNNTLEKRDDLLNKWKY
ncbi:MAG: extracellular solute-binding protein [Clostridia bacterium]|nr:extracellular solute-binding protein [Clostridia bacterium]